MGFGLGLKLGLGKGGGRPVNIQFLHNGFTAPDTLTTGALYVADNLGVLRTAGVDKIAIPGARLSGSDFVLTDTEGAQLFTSASVRTKSQGSVTQYTDADWQGMLVARESTNILLHSEDCSNPYYTKNSATISPNATTGPDGESTADKLIEMATTALHECVRGINSTAGVYTHSRFFKAAERSWVWLNIYDGSGHMTWFNLTTGAVGTNAAGNTATIEAFADGWYRCSISRSVATSSPCYWAFGTAPDDNVSSFLGDITKGVFTCSGQVETGILTPYIPTTTTTVTRAATVPSFTSANQLRANDMGGRVHVLPSAAGQTGWLFNSYTGATAEFGLLANPTTIVLRNRNSSVDTDLTLSYTHVADREFEVDWLKLATGMHMRVREKIAGTWQAWSAWSDLTSAGAQADATIAATYQYARNGANQFAASRPNFYTLFDATKAKLESLQ